MAQTLHPLSRFDLSDESATEALARRLAAAARPGDVLALWGDMGVGKTVFARAFVRSLCDPFEDVPSPTFTLVQVYESANPASGTIYHFDLFRLQDPEEAYELGIEEAFVDAISLIEWPDRLGRLLPDHRLDIRLAEGHKTDSRRAALEARGERPTDLLENALD